MNRKKRGIVLILISAALVSLAITAVIATETSSKTPLFTYRMEQKSNQMNFLSTEINEFTYTAESEYTLKFDNIHGNMDKNAMKFVVQPDGTYYPTCTYICPFTEELSCNWCINTVC